MKTTLAAFSIALLPVMASAEAFIMWGNQITEYGAWKQVKADKNPADGCGALALKEFTPPMQDAIAKRGCGIVLIGEIKAVYEDANPKDGCGPIELGFLMPQAQKVVLSEGCKRLSAHSLGVIDHIARDVPVPL